MPFRAHDRNLLRFSILQLFGLIFLASCITQCVQGSLTVTWHDGTQATFEAAPIQVGGNEITFDDVSGELVLANSTLSKDGKIVLHRFKGHATPYDEQDLVTYQEQYKPKAVIIYGESHVQDDYFELGVFQSFHMGVDTSIVDYPVVQITWRSYYEILAALENDTSVGINGTVTDGDVNEWYAVRHGWWFPFWITFSYVWGVVNVALCIYLLIGSECAKSLRIICLGLSLSSNLIRFLFLLDPFIGWLWPNAIVHVWFTGSIPLTVMNGVFIILYWHELVTAHNVTLSGFLTSSKVPAGIICVILCVFEAVTASLRAAGRSITVVTFINSAVYVVIGIGIICVNIYVAVRVFIFINQVSRVRSTHRMLIQVSIRFLLSTVGIILIITAPVISLTNFFYTAFGESFVHFLTILALNLQCTPAILGFQRAVQTNSTNGSSKTISRTSSAHHTSSAV